MYIAMFKNDECIFTDIINRRTVDEALALLKEHKAEGGAIRVEKRDEGSMAFYLLPPTFERRILRDNLLTIQDVDVNSGRIVKQRNVSIGWGELEMHFKNDPFVRSRSGKTFVTLTPYQLAKGKRPKEILA